MGTVGSVNVADSGTNGLSRNSQSQHESNSARFHKLQLQETHSLTVCMPPQETSPASPKVSDNMPGLPIWPFRMLFAKDGGRISKHCEHLLQNPKVSHSLFSCYEDLFNVSSSRNGCATMHGMLHNKPSHMLELYVTLWKLKKNLQLHINETEKYLGLLRERGL